MVPKVPFQFSVRHNHQKAKAFVKVLTQTRVVFNREPKVSTFFWVFFFHNLGYNTEVTCTILIAFSTDFFTMVHFHTAIDFRIFSSSIVFFERVYVNPLFTRKH